MKTKIATVIVSLSLGLLFAPLDGQPWESATLTKGGNWEDPTLWSPQGVPAQATPTSENPPEATHSVNISGLEAAATVLLEGYQEEGVYRTSRYRIGEFTYNDTYTVVFRNAVPPVGSNNNNVVLDVVGDFTKQGTGTLSFTNNTRGQITLVVGGDLIVSEGRLDLGTPNAGAGGIALAVAGNTVVSGTGVFSMRTGSRRPISDPYAMGGVSVSDEGILRLYAGGNASAVSQHYRFDSLNGDGTIQVANSTGTLFTGNIWLTTSGENHFSGVIREVAQSGQTDVNATLALHMTGTGSIRLSGANTYKGGTEVRSGTIIADHDSALGEGAVEVNDSGTLVVNAGRTLNNAFTVSNGGSLIVDGALQGADTSVTLDGAVRIGGSGSIGTLVAFISTDQVLAPGNSPGTLTFTESQQWNGFTYEWQINDWTDQSADAGIHYDQILIEGQLDLAGATEIQLLLESLEVDDLPGLVYNFAESSRSWIILSATDGVTGFDESAWEVLTDSFQNVYQGEWSVELAGSDILLNYTAIPEPETAMLVLLVVCGAGVMIRKKRLSVQASVNR